MSHDTAEKLAQKMGLVQEPQTGHVVVKAQVEPLILHMNPTWFHSFMQPGKNEALILDIQKCAGS